MPTLLAERIECARPYALALFRLSFGLLFACSGAASLFGVLGGVMGTGNTAPVGSWPGWYAAVIEFACGILLMLGLGTRMTAFIASGVMAYAYFSVHQGKALWPIQNGGEAAAMFCWAFLLIVFTGPGVWALDNAIIAAQKSRIPTSIRHHCLVATAEGRK